VGISNEPNGIRQNDNIERLLSKVPGNSSDGQLQGSRNLQAKIEALERESKPSKQKGVLEKSFKLQMSPLQ